jgi:integrase
MVQPESQENPVLYRVWLKESRTMPVRTPRTPSYRLFKPRGQAVVTIDGKDHYLGKYGTAQSKAEYDRLIAEWLANGRCLPAAAGTDLSMNELIAAYWKHVESYYVKDGAPTSEVATIRYALRFVRQLYGHTLAKDFGPLALKAVRQAMVEHPVTRRFKVVDPETRQTREEAKVIRHGLARRYINKQVGRIKRMFAWAVEEELVPVTVHQALLRIKGLKKGKGQAREKPRVQPVPDAFVEAILPVVPPGVRTMIEVQRLCGGRPQDIVLMRAIDIDMTGPVWEYRPSRYKTEHRDEDAGGVRERIVFLGPKAQAFLKPYLTLNLTDYLFSPQRSEAERYARKRAARQSKRWPSHVRHQQRKRARRQRAALRDHYDVASYRRAIRRACLKTGVPIWSPNQLRHSAGTNIRKRYGLEASQACLGHTELGVTQVYAEVDFEKARRVMAEIG